MTGDSVRGQVRSILKEKLQIELPDTTTDLLDNGSLDSLGFVELVYHIEERFGVTIDLASMDLDDFRTAESISAGIERLLDGRNAETPDR